MVTVRSASILATGNTPHDHQKVTSGSMPRIADVVNACTPDHHGRNPSGTSIKVAEAAKVIENTQRREHRLINELTLIFKRIGIDTEEVPGSWNEMEFRRSAPLVGALHRRGTTT